MSLRKHSFYAVEEPNWERLGLLLESRGITGASFTYGKFPGNVLVKYDDPGEDKAVEIDVDAAAHDRTLTPRQRFRRKLARVSKEEIVRALFDADAKAALQTKLGL